MKNGNIIDVVSKQKFEYLINNSEYSGVITDMIRKYIDENYKNEYDFLAGWDSSSIITQINFYLRPSFISFYPTMKEFINIDNYEKYFRDEYGINAVEKKLINNTQRISNFFDELLKDIPNKEIFFTHLGTYIKTGDLAEFHNKIHQIE
jgi:hypothetical protein